jgi:hypothetical protein
MCVFQEGGAALGYSVPTGFSPSVFDGHAHSLSDRLAGVAHSSLGKHTHTHTEPTKQQTQQQQTKQQTNKTKTNKTNNNTRQDNNNKTRQVLFCCLFVCCLFVVFVVCVCLFLCWLFVLFVLCLRLCCLVVLCVVFVCCGLLLLLFVVVVCLRPTEVFGLKIRKLLLATSFRILKSETCGQQKFSDFKIRDFFSDLNLRKVVCIADKFSDFKIRKLVVNRSFRILKSENLC